MALSARMIYGPCPPLTSSNVWKPMSQRHDQNLSQTAFANHMSMPCPSQPSAIPNRNLNPSQQSRILPSMVFHRLPPMHLWLPSSLHRRRANLLSQQQQTREEWSTHASLNSKNATTAGKNDTPAWVVPNAQDMLMIQNVLQSVTANDRRIAKAPWRNA